MTDGTCSPKTVAEGFKLCRKCAEIKPVEAFATKPYGDGKRTRASRCKECLKAERAQDRREHGDRVNENARKAYARNPARKKASKAAYWERHRDDLVRAQRERYRILYPLHPELWLSSNARRKQKLAVKMDALDRALSRGYRAAIRDDPCFYCGQRIAGDMHGDHFFPLAKGGTDHWWNLVRSCGPCNRRKHAYCGTWFLLKTGTAVAVAA